MYSRKAMLALLAGIAAAYYIHSKRIRPVILKEIGVDSASGEDFISQLSDDILSSILSCLHMRDAVRTSILSKRWRHVYRSMENLNLDLDTMFKTPERVHTNHFASKRAEICSQRLNDFIKGVDQLLQLSSATKLFSFRLAFCIKREFSCYVERWISVLARMNVEELDLNFECMEPLNFDLDSCFSFRYNNLGEQSVIIPFHLLTEACNLRSLHLYACTLAPSFNGQMKCLKNLELDRVPLAGGEIHSILSCCVNVELLRLQDCSLPAKLSISGRCPQLTSLFIHNCQGMKQIELDGINLITFECHQSVALNNVFSTASTLETVSLIPYLSGGLYYVSQELAKYLPNLKSLQLRLTGMEIHRIPESFTLFFSLTELIVQFSHCDLVDILEITPIFSACPNLQKFHLALVSAGGRFYNAHRRGQVPKTCHLTQLKEVEYDGFCGTENDMDFALYLVKSATALELMSISTKVKFYEGQGRWTWSGNPCISEMRKVLVVDELEWNAVSKNLKLTIE